MNHPAAAQLSFEREKNIKAGAITIAICALVLLFFILTRWVLPTIPPNPIDLGIEVNLGTSETGLGSEAPALPGSPAASEATGNVAAPAASSPPPAQTIASTSNEVDANAPATSNIVAEKKVLTTASTAKTKNKVSTNIIAKTPSLPKPKAVFTTVNSNGNGGNNNDGFNDSRNQGVAGGKGVQGAKNGNPNSNAYANNSGKGGISIRSGLGGRRITKLPTFEDDFNSPAKVAVLITVDKMGKVTSASIDPKGTTTTDANIKKIAINRARTLTFNVGDDDDQSGTIVFDFKLSN